MRQPPKSRSKLTPTAQAEVGSPRECRACGEIKPVSRQTFYPSTKGFHGWDTVCIVCRMAAKSEVAAKEWIRNPREKLGNETVESIERMYLLSASNRNPTEVAAISGELARRVRTLHEVGKELESFNLFIDIVKPLIANWTTPGLIHDDIKNGLLSEHNRVLIIATRFSAKSTLTAIYVAWQIFLDPLIKVMIISRGAKLASRMLRTVRRVIMANCPMLEHLCPAEECIDNIEQFQTPQALRVITGGATLTSLGMGSNLPGYRADLTIGDDVEGPKDDTPEKVSQLEEDLNELHMINPKGRKIMLGTYQSEFSVYAKLADLQDEEGNPVWEHHRACMFEETEDGIHSRWNEMFTDKDALDWRRSVTHRAWRLHAMLIADPSVLHEKPLKISDLPILEWNTMSKVFPLGIERTTQQSDAPRWSAPKGDVWYVARPMEETAPLAANVMAVDPASGLAGRDAIGVAILGITQSGLGIIRHLEGVRSHDKAIARRRVAQIAQSYSASVILVEEMADGLFGEILEGELVTIGYPMVVEKVTVGGQQKGRRIIESLGPPMGAGRLIMLDSVARNDHGGEFVNQLVRISYDGKTSRGRDNDDIVDALAHAVAREKNSLVSDVSENISEYHKLQIDRWARVPMRYGGLGAEPETELSNHRTISLGGDRDLVESLIEEDEVLIALTDRRDRLQEVINEDLRFGRGPEQSIINKIRALTSQIKQLQELQVF